MAYPYIDLRTLKFFLFAVHGLEHVLKQPRFQDHDSASIDLFLDSVKDFSDKELFPFFEKMDRTPAAYRNGEIVVHPQVRRFMKKGAELGLIAALFDYESGGLQLPLMAVTAATYIQDAANNHLPGYLGLTLGAAELIDHFGGEGLKQTYLPKMLSGDWGGTMCLTEPQAGSSLSDITTTARPDGDHYLLSGQKIFISGGDYQGVENIVHLVLARIAGAPPGTAGISLFVVPKNRPGAAGSLEPNDVTTVGDFQKMGQRGYCTTHLSFGDRNDCRGWLVGDANRGLSYMFKMMNGARIGVGRGAAAIAMAAYQASLAYAKERPQGRRLGSSGAKDLSQQQTLIINHPDVKRMLLLQKAVVEGSLSLVLLASKYQDLSAAHTDPAEREKYRLLLEIVTPLAKTYPSEMGAVSVSNGLQVLGGYGFCSDFPLQQYHRDIRIFAIYEGTTGIQSLDLLGRKVTLENGRALELLAAEISLSIKQASGVDQLVPYALQLKEKLGLVQTVLTHLLPYAQKGEHERYLATATVFMEFFSTVVLAWLWLDAGRTALEASQAGDSAYPPDFCAAKVRAMQFYFNFELPKTTALAEVIVKEEGLTLEPPSALFR